MRTISQRELRNDNAQVIRGVERGESFTVTRRGVPVARLVPLSEATGLPCARPAKKRPLYSTQRRISVGSSTEDLLDDMRGDR